MKHLYQLAFLVLYPLAHLIFIFWPIFLGIQIGWGLGDGVALWALWYIPAILILFRINRSIWWTRLQSQIDLLTR